MTPPSVHRFLKLLRHRPKWVGNEFDGIVLVQFRERSMFSPSLEFYTIPRKDGSRRLYFEILDLRGYEECELIPLDSELRKEVLHVFLTDDRRLLAKPGYMSPKDAAGRIDSSLRLLHSGRLDGAPAAFRRPPGTGCSRAPSSAG